MHYLSVTLNALRTEIAFTVRTQRRISPSTHLSRGDTSYREIGCNSRIRHSTDIGQTTGDDDDQRHECSGKCPHRRPLFNHYINNDPSSTL